MNTTLLVQHISVYKQNLLKDPEKHSKDLAERKERIAYYQSWTKERILSMTEEDFYDYLSRLWAMLIWGNKHYVVDKMIADNGFDTVKQELA
ncbi:MAG: hypothetical protein LLG97_11295, partial [Deltaproteobacteria bacterium]|nr:hypothetical protein [Deltaproteobacteria bacterium]